MKILYHHRTRSKDGQAVHIDELVSALRARGHDVKVVGPSLAEEASFGDDGGTVNTLKRRLPRAAYELMEFSYAWLAYLRLKKAYARFGPDVLYERYNLFMPAGLWLKRRYGLPLLLEVNSPLLAERSKFGGITFRRLARWTEQSLWQGADYVLPVTEVLAEIIRDTDVDDDRIVVIPNAIDPKRFSQKIGKAEAKKRVGLAGSLVLGFTGFMREWHGLDNVIDLFADLNPDLAPHLLIVGDGPARLQLEVRANRLGVADKVTFTGLIGRDAVADYVAAFDIALQPAVRPYASPLKLFEYMALGCAIIAPRTPNIEEVLSDGKTAFLFDPECRKSFVAALEQLCRDARLRERIGAAAREAITEKGFTWENNARRVEVLIRQCANSIGDPSRGLEGQ